MHSTMSPPASALMFRYVQHNAFILQKAKLSNFGNPRFCVADDIRRAPKRLF
jgi:hypothetical protein